MIYMSSTPLKVIHKENYGGVDLDDNSKYDEIDNGRNNKNNNNNDTDNYQEPFFGKILSCLGSFFGCCCTYFCCACCCYPYKTVNKGHKGIITKFGRVEKVVADGMWRVNPMTQKLSLVDMRQRAIDLPKQTVMTHDNISVTIDSVIFFRVIDAVHALFSIVNLEYSITELSLTTLRTIFGKYNLQMCLENRDKIAEEIQKIVSIQITNWGAEIISLQFKDITVRNDIKSSLISATIATRDAEAKRILASADVTNAQLMRQASDILDTPGAMQIRYNETLTKIASSPNTKIIFIPMEPMKLGDIRNITSITEMNKD